MAMTGKFMGKTAAMLAGVLAHAAALAQSPPLTARDIEAEAPAGVALVSVHAIAAGVRVSGYVFTPRDAAEFLKALEHDIGAVHLISLRPLMACRRRIIHLVADVNAEAPGLVPLQRSGPLRMRQHDGAVFECAEEAVTLTHE